MIVDLRSVDPVRPDPPGEYALQLVGALVRITPHLDITVLEPGFTGPVPSEGTLLMPAGGRPRPGQRCITAVHEVASLRPGRLAARFRAAFAVSRSEIVLAPSTHGAQMLTRYLRADSAKVRVILPGIDAGLARTSREETEQLRRELGLPARYLLAFGDQAQARQAFSAATVPREQAGLVDADGLNPTREQLPALLSGALGVLFCQHRLSCGMLALQAMACGAPPVVPDDGAFPELVRDAGLTIPAGSPQAWPEAISALYRSAPLRMQLSRRGRELAAELTAERAARSLAALL